MRKQYSSYIGFEREGRLVFFDNHTEDGVRSVTGSLGNGVEHVLSTLKALPVGIAKGIGDVLKDNVDSDNEPILQSMKNMLLGAPKLQGLLNKFDVEQLDSAEKIHNFFSVRNWLEIFENAPDMLFDAHPDFTTIQSGKNEGILNFLQDLSPQERQIVFHELVDRYVPEKVQSAHASVFETLKKSSGLKRNDVSRLSSILGGVLGIHDRSDYVGPTADEDKAIITTSIEDALLDSTGKHATNTTYAEYLSVMRSMKLRSVDAAAEDPIVLSQYAQDSVLRGGITFGVLDKNMLRDMHNASMSLVEGQQKDVGKITTNLEELTHITSKEAQREAMSLADTWYDMEPWQKVALVAIAIVGLMNKTVRNISVAAGAAYFADKFFLKGEGARLVGMLSDKASDTVVGLNRKALAGWLDDSFAGQGVAARAETVTKFLTEYDVANLEYEGTGFALLSGVPLKDLALSYAVSPDDWSIDVSSQSPMMRRLRTYAEKEGISRSSLSFFDEPEHQVEVADALTYVFYKIAAKNPANAEYVQIVEEHWGRQILNGPNRSQLYRGDSSSPAGRAYRTLIEIGRTQAASSDMTLGNFMLQNLDDVQNDSLEENSTPLNIDPEQQKFIEQMLKRDVLVSPLTEAEEKSIVDVLPFLPTARRKRIQAVLEKHVDHNYRTITFDAFGIGRLAYLLAGLPHGTQLDRLRLETVTYCADPAHIDSALQLSIARENFSGIQQMNIQKALDLIVLKQSESLMHKLQTIPTANLLRHTEYDNILETAEKLYVCSPINADEVTDIASFLLEYTLYQGHYQDPDADGKVGEEKFQAYLDVLREKYGLSRNLQISEKVSSPIYARGTYTAKSRLQQNNVDMNNAVFTFQDLFTTNLSERIVQLLKERNS